MSEPTPDTQREIVNVFADFQAAVVGGFETLTSIVEKDGQSIKNLYEDVAELRDAVFALSNRIENVTRLHSVKS